MVWYGLPFDCYAIFSHLPSQYTVLRQAITTSASHVHYVSYHLYVTLDLSFGSLWRPPAYLQVIPPLIHAVAFGDLGLEKCHARHEGGETSNGLTTAATDAYKQCVPTWLL